MMRQDVQNQSTADCRALVERWYANGEITLAARQRALALLYPHQQWGLWGARMLLWIGTALVLSGIIYFCAFNWDQIPPLGKLFSLQALLLGVLCGALFGQVSSMPKQLLLMSASVLLGAFLAVFGQVYQTGADAYQLFLTWSLLILGWCSLSKFAAHWLLWIVVTDLFILLFWAQWVLPSHRDQLFSYFLVASFNGLLLIMREYSVLRLGQSWLASHWVRGLLITAVLLPLMIPMIIVMIGVERSSILMKVGFFFGLCIHLALYWFYQHRMQDRLATVLLVLSGTIIVEVLAIKVIAEIFDDALILMFLFMGLMTICLFTGAVHILRRLIERGEGHA